jgi:hypothetical protein
VKQYLDRFMQPRGKRWYRIPKKISVIIAQQGLKWDSEINYKGWSIYMSWR